jgi:hypothetical protein
MRALELPLYGAVGILEALWNLCAREAPQGNIGKLQDADIADAVGWEKEPTMLVSALIECGWIDKSSAHRLVIHDWHDHADDTTKKYLARSSLPFLSGNVEKNPDVSPLPCRSLARAMPEPEPIVEPDLSVSDPQDVAERLKLELQINLGYGPNSLRDAVIAVAEVAQKSGQGLEDFSALLIASCSLYRKERKNLRTPWGWAKFIGEGYWRDPASWPWRENYDAECGEHSEEYAGLIERIAGPHQESVANGSGLPPGEGWFQRAAGLR